MNNTEHELPLCPECLKKINNIINTCKECKKIPRSFINDEIIRI